MLRNPTTNILMMDVNINIETRNKTTKTYRSRLENKKIE